MSELDSITAINSDIIAQQLLPDNSGNQDQIASTNSEGLHAFANKDVSGLSSVLASLSSVGYAAGAADNTVGLISAPPETTNNQDNLPSDSQQNMAMTIAMAMGGSFDSMDDLQAINDQKELASVLENNFFKEISNLSNQDKINAMNALENVFGDSAIMQNAIKDIKSQASDLQTIEDQRVELKDSGNADIRKANHTSKAKNFFCGMGMGHGTAYYADRGQGKLDQARELDAQEGQIASSVSSSSTNQAESFSENSKNLSSDFSQLLQVEGSLGDMATSRGA